MHASTPTPSLPESTILAGHLDLSMIDEIDTTQHSIAEDIDKNEDSASDDFLDQYLRKIPTQGAKVHSTPKPQEDKTTKQNYCNDRMKRNSGVSITNSDQPPSLNEPGVALSDSLLDLTSVS